MKKEKDPKQVYLERYLTLCHEIEALDKAIERTKAEAVATNSIVSGASPSAGHLADKVGNSTAKLIDLLSDLAAKKSLRTEAKIQIIRVIYSIGDTTLRTILVQRYINGLKFQQIAKSMDYDIRNIFRLHAKALDEIKIKDVIECHN